MRRGLLIIGILAIFALIAAPVFAGTLYEQEGTPDDGPSGINAAGANSNSNASWTNWKYQYGEGSWSGVYNANTGDAWTVASVTGDSSIDIEADIEMYFSQSISKNKVYFHLGNIYTATTDDLTAYVDGTFSSNNGQYIGISFNGANKDANSFAKDTEGHYTGVILGGMQSDNDTYRAQDNQMDLEILLSWGAGWRAPNNYGDGAHSTYTDTLWWLVNDGAPGTYNYKWRIRLLPVAHQPDGDYYLDPVVVSTPVL